MARAHKAAGRRDLDPHDNRPFASGRNRGSEGYMKLTPCPGCGVGDGQLHLSDCPKLFGAPPKIGSNRGNAGKGRPRGSPNKATATIKDLARKYTADALQALVGVLKDGGDAAKVSAAKELLDRGYGKASTVLAGDEDGGPMKLVHEIRLVGVRAAHD